MIWQKGVWWQLTWHNEMTGCPMVTITVRFLWEGPHMLHGGEAHGAGAGEGPHGGIS